MNDIVAYGIAVSLVVLSVGLSIAAIIKASRPRIKKNTTRSTPDVIKESSDPTTVLERDLMTVMSRRFGLSMFATGSLPRNNYYRKG